MNKCWLLAALVLLAVPSPGAAASRQGEASGGERRDLPYRMIGDRALKLDFYAPPRGSGARAPVVLHMHGGGWSRGARPPGAAAFRPWLEAGFAVAAIEYRLAGEAKAPAAVDDVRCAMAWVAANAERLRVDPARIVLTGTSAGGHLALVAGLRVPGNADDPRGCESAPAPVAIVNLYGPADLRRRGDAPESASIGNWIGDGGDALRTAMSPVTLMRADMPPTFTIHGDADPVVPVASAHLLARSAQAAGARHGLHIVPGGGHGGFARAERDRAMAAAFAFLRAERVVR